MAKKKNFDVQIIVSYGDKSATSKYKIDSTAVKAAYFSDDISEAEPDDEEEYADSLEIPASKIAKVVKTIAAQVAYEANDNEEYVLFAVTVLNSPPPRRGGR